MILSANLRALALVSLIVVGLGAAGAGLAVAQTTTTTVAVLKDSLDAPVALPDRPSVTNRGEALVSLTIFADREECGVLSLVDPAARDAAGDAVFELGPAGQPAACSKEGATLSFVDGNGLVLYEKLKLVPGARLELINLAPEPPGTGGTPVAPAAGTGLQPGGSSLSRWLLPAVAALSLTAAAFAIKRRSS